MAIKTFKVSLSLDNPRIIQSGIDVRSFDKQSIKIAIELTKDSQAYQIPTGATIRISLLKLARQEQKIIVDVPNTNRDSIDWIVPDYLDGYQGTVRVGVYLVSGAENVDLGYFTILSNVSDIDKMADEFVDNVFQGWEQIEADLNELNLTIAQTESDLNDILTTADSAIANINAKNTQVNTLHSAFTTDVATKQTDVTSKYNAFDTSVTQAGQTIDDILGLADDVQEVSAQVAEKVQNFKIKNEIVNGDFSQGVTGWVVPNFTLENGKIYTTLADYNTNNYQIIPTLTAGRKYYLSAKNTLMSGAKSSGLNSSIALFMTAGTTLKSNIVYSKVDGSGNLLSGQFDTPLTKSLIFVSDGTENRINLARTLGSTFATVKYYWDDVILLDLTTTFGAGNEPTKLEMDELMKVIPNHWWDGELSLTQKQFVTWQLNLIRKNTNAIIALGGTIV